MLEGGSFDTFNQARHGQRLRRRFSLSRRPLRIMHAGDTPVTPPTLLLPGEKAQ